MAAQVQYVLITGCSDGGIGSSLARKFHDNGLHVFATARNLSKMQELQDLHNITFLKLDVTQPESIQAAYKVVEAHTGGKLHYLVNNSGSGYVMPFLDSDIETSKHMFDVNVWGVVRVTQVFAPLVILARGTIVNNASTAGCVGLPYQGIYCASKGAVELMSETMALEMKPLGVNVVTVITGNIKTRWFLNVPQFVLPENSYYAPIKTKVAAYSRGDISVPWMDVDVYAEQVVRDVLGGAQGTIWRGAQSRIIRMVLPWMPGWLVRMMLAKGTGLDTFRL